MTLLLQQLQCLISSLHATSENWDLSINVQKSKIMAYNRYPDKHVANLNSKVNEGQLEDVNYYIYLRRNINNNADQSIEIRRRIEIAMCHNGTAMQSKSFQFKRDYVL